MDFDWDGEAMRPIHSTYADRHYVVGERYRLVVEEERSRASHAHEFAWLHEAWLQLPEQLRDLYPTETHLRKRALIEGGFYDEDAVDAGTNAAALRMSAWIRKKDDFCLVIVRGPIVLIRTAKSQSHRAMGRKMFQESKDALIEIVSGMIGLTPDELRRNTGRAA